MIRSSSGVGAPRRGCGTSLARSSRRYGHGAQPPYSSPKKRPRLRRLPVGGDPDAPQALAAQARHPPGRRRRGPARSARPGRPATRAAGRCTTRRRRHPRPPASRSWRPCRHRLSSSHVEVAELARPRVAPVVVAGQALDVAVAQRPRPVDGVLGLPGAGSPSGVMRRILPASASCGSWARLRSAGLAGGDVEELAVGAEGECARRRGWSPAGMPVEDRPSCVTEAGRGRSSALTDQFVARRRWSA